MAGDIVGSPAVGSVGFSGRIDWRADAEGTSSGRLTVPGLDFTSPAGPVKGLRGTIDFTSLTPLVAAPGQSLHADLLESVAPLTDIDLIFGLDKAALTVEGADLSVAGGTVRVEPCPSRWTSSKASPASSCWRPSAGPGPHRRRFRRQGQPRRRRLGPPAVQLEPQGRRPHRRRQSAGGPALGRLSIPRSSLSGLEAEGGGEALPPNTVQDLAYQAMENLAFDILSAQVDSLDKGRLGVLFRIRGRHDPPQRQELRIPLADFISRQFLNRELPLPSNTGIDLTLETSLNLNELVSDLMKLDRARNGQADPAPPEEQSTP
jgi:hypothetical protein